MNNTALRAGAQSASNTHMVFADEEHKKIYYGKLEQAGYRDCYGQTDERKPDTQDWAGHIRKRYFLLRIRDTFLAMY